VTPSGSASRASRRDHAWLIPVALGAVATGYLSWGAWVSAHDPHWLYVNQAWWRIPLRPQQDGTLLGTAALWLGGLACFWWPRRLQGHLIGLITVPAMVVIGAVLGTASLIPCRGGMTRIGVSAWLLQLYVGQPPPAYQPGQSCAGQPPLALQLAQVVCLAATLIGALAVLTALWRQPADRLRVRFVRDVTVVTGLDDLAIPLLKRLAQTRSPRNIIVIEPDKDHPLLKEARLTGARVITGSPSAERLLRPIISGWRRCALSYLYALGSDVQENEAVLEAAAKILGRYRPDPERQPHIVARIDDLRHAGSWRGGHSGTPGAWFVDAINPAELTACTLVSRVLRSGARQLVLCGDSTLTMAVLLELARRAWEQAELAKAAAIGAATALAATPADDSGPNGSRPPADRASNSVERLILMDPRAADILREYLGSASPAVLDSAPEIQSRPVPWRDHLLGTLDALAPADARATAVIIVDRNASASMHEAGRVARLHAGTPVFVQAASGEGTDEAVFDLLHPFQQGLLVDGDVPEDAWTRVARHWHECFRLRHPVAPGDPRMYGRLPWDELDHFIRQDNILQLRSILSAVAARGRQWVPVRTVPPGSHIELTDTDVEEVAHAEHTRWYRRRLAAGWSAGGDHGSASDQYGAGGAAVTVRRPARSNASVMPWPQLPPGRREAVRESLRSQLAQLEDVGYAAIVPPGGPPEATRFHRIGIVEARKLMAPQAWERRCSEEKGEELQGEAGDWHVRDSFGDVRTVGNAEFRQSHEPLGGELWRRVGMFSAWRAREQLVIRTKEGQATAHPGDWVVEGALGERWPITDKQFMRTYRASGNAGEPALRPPHGMKGDHLDS
jgi:hypothetical protein